MNTSPIPNSLTLFDTDKDVTPILFENDQVARAYCLERWPDAEFAFCYLADLDNERQQVDTNLKKQIILSIVHKVPDDFDGNVLAYGHIVGAEFDMEVWSDAYYYGELADKIEADAESSGNFEDFGDPENPA